MTLNCIRWGCCAYHMTTTIDNSKVVVMVVVVMMICVCVCVCVCDIYTLHNFHCYNFLIDIISFFLSFLSKKPILCAFYSLLGNQKGYCKFLEIQENLYGTICILLWGSIFIIYLWKYLFSKIYILTLRSNLREVQSMYISPLKKYDLKSNTWQNIYSFNKTFCSFTGFLGRWFVGKKKEYWIRKKY